MCSNTKTKLHGIQGHQIIGNGLENHFQYYQQFDEAVHGFREQCSTGMAILTNKLRTQRSAVDTIDCTATLRIQGGYGIGPNIQRLLGTFWGRHTVIPRASGYHGRAFRGTRGVTQGDIISPMIFNLVLDCIIKAWKLEHPEKAEIIQAIFYADNGLLQTEDAEAIQEALDEFTEYFLQEQWL
jgi:hypothetical protein